MAKIYTYSILRSSTEAFADRLPYCSAILELEDGSHVAALLDGYVDGMTVEIGMEVKNMGTAENPQYSL